MSLYHMPTGRYVDALEGFTLQACHDLAVDIDLYTAAEGHQRPSRDEP